MEMVSLPCSRNGRQGLTGATQFVTVKNAFKLILPSSSTPPDKTAFKKILALVQRSDAVAVKSEGTRVLVNVIKSLWSADIPSTDETSRERRKAAMDIVANPASAAALAQLIGRSRKYPLLINEGVVALSLLSAHTGGGLFSFSIFARFRI